MAPQPASTQILATYLATGYWQATGNPAHTWDLSSSNVVTVNLTGLTAAGQALARNALDAWEAVADIRFSEVTGPARITFDDSRTGAITNVELTRSGDLSSAHVNIGTDWLSRHGTHLGSYSFQTYMHEIGHALGLGHAGTYGGGAPFSDANFTIDSWQQSVMSYYDQNENPVVAADKAYLLTPMMADILAIQMLYGRPGTTASAGDTRYGMGGNSGTYLDLAMRGAGSGLAGRAATIFDQGGSDTINFADDTRAQVMDLRAGTFSTVYGTAGNLGIAIGTMIENFVAGSGSDRVTGNNAANRLDLRGGNDSANGMAGNDILLGGDGADQLLGLQGDDLLRGDGGADRLTGGGGNDVLQGGSGADRLTGNVGNDRLVGGAGVDVFIFSAGNDVILDFQDGVDTIAIDDALWGGAPRTPEQLAALGQIVDGDLVFTFAGGHTLRIENVTDTRVLTDDLAIV
jgi:serralysin